MKVLLSIGACFLAAFGGVLLCSCDSEPVSSSVEISPSSASIRQGQSILFTAMGGYDYRWSLSNNNLGVLSTGVGETTTYTSVADTGGTNTTQVLTLVSTIEGAHGGDGTNAAYQATAEAFITHL